MKRAQTALRSIAGGLALAFAASACGGHGGTAALPASPAGGSNAPAAAGSFGYDAALVQSSQYVGPAKFGRLAFNVAVRWRNPQGLAAYAAAASDPSSPLYRHFLEPQEIADRFLATQADYNAAAAYLRGQGIAVGTWRQRMVLHVNGTQAQLERAFGTTFGVYRNGTETFVAPSTRPQLPAAVPIVGSVDIVKRPQRYHHSFVRASGISNGRLTGFAPQQIAAAFDYTGAYNAGFTGAGITLGIIGTGPVSVSAGSRIGDAEAYKAFFGVKGSSGVSIVSANSGDPVVNGASGFATPPPVTGPCSGPGDDGSSSPSISPTATCNPEDVEAQIDTEQAASLARDSSVQFFLSYNPNDGCAVPNGQACAPGAGYAYQGLAEPDEELQTAIDRNTADVLSLSYGGAEFSEVGTGLPYPFKSDGTGLEPTIFQALVALGIAVFASSGDAGSNECQQTFPQQANALCVSYPATDPSVVAVGGVTSPLDGAGKIVGPLAAWGLQTNGGVGATGGGVSAYFGLPAYQQGIAGIQGGKRNIPDVALEADPATGIAVLLYADKSFGGAQFGVVGGTSVAAPEMAAMWALVLQACKQTSSCAVGPSAHPYRLGNPNPLFYGIYKNAARYAATFYDVTYGNNAQLTYCQGAGVTDPTNCPTPAPGPPTLAPGYNAGVGYDLDTGIGVPFARSLIRAVVGI